MTLAAAEPALRRFADPSRVSEGWYVLARSRALRRGRIATVQVGPREVVAYRGLDGVVRALDARCAHLGAHLDRGRVTPDGLECAFHGWCWDARGACARAEGHATPPARRTRAYATTERWGLAWAWLGAHAPAFDVPDPTPPGWRAVRLPPQRIRCHPHIVLGNAFDLAHLSPTHGFDLDAPPRVTTDPPHRMRLDVEGRLPRRGVLRPAGLAGTRFDASFESVGATLHVVDVRAPVRFRVLFTGRPDAEGACRAQTLLFLPRRLALPRALAMLWYTTIDDMRLMEALQFRPAFSEADGAFAGYARFIEAMPTW